MQRALLELLLLAVPAGLVGTWIVLRDLAFYAHAVGAATFPALVCAEAWGIAPQLTALAGVSGFSVGLQYVVARSKASHDSVTALFLIAALALGVILASDVFKSSGQVGSLLFGSLLATSDTDLLFTLLLIPLTVVVIFSLNRAWATTGFDSSHAGSLGVRVAKTDAVLLFTIALATVVAVTAVGSLFAAALFVVPAATARAFTHSIKRMALASVFLVAGEGVTSLWLAYQLNLPPGAALALTAGVVFLSVRICQGVLENYGPKSFLRERAL